jgi:hypothetical protein
MDKRSEAILALKPVTFRYKHELDPKGTAQFGLLLSPAIAIRSLDRLEAIEGVVGKIGTQTGERGPQFNGYYFNIGEAGAAWEIGINNLPGSLGIGLWNQSGQLRAGNVTESGATGVYLFGSQRLWFRNPGKDNSGIIGFFSLARTTRKRFP